MNLSGQITFATFLTITRMILALPIVYAIAQGYLIAGSLLFVIAALTDFFDGYCARAFNQETVLGALLDPVADKLLLVSSFIALTFCAPITYRLISPYIVFLLCARELVLLLGGLYVIRNNGSSTVKPLLLGKVATCLQITTFLMGIAAIYHNFLHVPFVLLTYLMLGITLCATAQYLARAARVILVNRDRFLQ